MKSLEFITHGTSSEKDAEEIKNEGFKAEEGRGTVSGDLIYAFKWATEEERRRATKSKSKVSKGEKGRMIIMKVPQDKSIDYATHTGIEVDEASKEITGYSSKYVSGRRQIAIYNEGDVVEKRRKIEQAKKELDEINAHFFAFLRENNIDLGQIKSREDLVEAIKSFDTEKKIQVLKQAEEFERQRAEKTKEAKPNSTISQENILMSIIPTTELGKKLGELSQKMTGFEKVNLENFTDEISKIIEDNKENFLASGVDVREVIGDLLASTMETEVVNLARSFSMKVKRARGYEVYNRGTDEKKEEEVDKEQLKQELEQILSVVEADDFDIGMENLNRYIKVNVKKLLEELER